MRIPESIKPGDTLAIVAPSFGATTEPYTFRFEEAIRQFKEKGYKVLVGDCCHKSDGLGISTNPKDAAEELMRYYLDPSVKAVLSCGGGELMCETAGYIDFEKLKAAPAKWFMGYSDNTNFIFPLATLCDTAAVYGPNAPGLGKPWEQSETDAWNILEGKTKVVSGYEMFQNPEVESEDPLSPYIYTDPKELKSFIPEERKLVKAGVNQTFCMEGTLMGGCLDCLVTLSGTKLDGVKDFNKNHDKVIWMLESCDYNPMDIRRAFWHLKESGWFEKAAGFIIGRPFAAFRQEVMGVNQYNAVTDILEELKVPVIMDVDVGHIDPAMPLVIGAESKITVKGNDIKIEMNL